MNKTIVIKDYAGKKTNVEIYDFENVQSIFVQILSGDEVIRVRYKDGRCKRYDSSDCRIESFFDGDYFLPLDKLDEFSAFNRSYDALSVFGAEEDKP